MSLQTSLACILHLVVLLAAMTRPVSGQRIVCTDESPDEYYSCPEHKGFGNCHKAYMVTEAPDLPQGYCQTSCGRCPTKSDTTPIKKLQSLVQKVSQQRHRSASYHNSATRPRSLLATTTCSCTDTQPDSSYTCAQQKAFGKCSADFVTGKGHCQTTCGKCSCNPTCQCDDVQPAGGYSCNQQKSFGKCSADFMKKGSRSSPFAPNGYCCITCGSCSCNSAQTSSRPTTSQSPSRPSTAQSPSRPAAQVPHPPVLATIAPRSPRLSPVTAATAAASLSPRASPSNAATSSPRAPPAPLSAAYLANCECTDVPPADASSCAAVIAAGHCDVYGTVIGNSAHPEGFCQQTCNRCNYYCVPKNGRSAPATPARSSSRAPSSGCSDTPPDNQYSCAQQKSFGKCGQSFMTNGNHCARACGRCS